MVEEVFDDFVLGDESENLHLAAASVTGQGVDFVDAIDELAPSFGESGSWRAGRFGCSGGVVVSERGADSIGVSAVEMDEMLVGLGDMYEDSCQKLERVGQSIVVELVSVFGLVEEQAGVAVESETGKVDRSPHEVASQLM